MVLADTFWTSSTAQILIAVVVGLVAFLRRPCWERGGGEGSPGRGADARRHRPCTATDGSRRTAMLRAPGIPTA
jgi:hypothetical protein